MLTLFSLSNFHVSRFCSWTRIDLKSVSNVQPFKRAPPPAEKKKPVDRHGSEFFCHAAIFIAY